MLKMIKAYIMKSRKFGSAVPDITITRVDYDGATCEVMFQYGPDDYYADNMNINVWDMLEFMVESKEIPNA